MKITLTDEELAALSRIVSERGHLFLYEDRPCDCPLHQLSKEERAKRIDLAIQKTNEEFRIQEKA